MLIVRRDSHGDRIPIDFTSIKSLIKNKLCNSEKRKWGDKEINGYYSVGNDPSKYPLQLPLLVANIFALWSLMNSDDYQKQEDMDDGSQTNLKGYLLQPHVA